MSDAVTDDLPPTEDKPEVTVSTWTTGKKRTQQYYATRRGLRWQIYSIKTREPLDAMKAAWGSELDVITMLAMLPPKPIKRGWYRFKESLEVVDLGRNRKKADEQFEDLKREMNDYKHTTQAADPSKVEDVRRTFGAEARVKRWARVPNRMVGQADAFEKMAKTNWALELCSEVVIPPTFDDDETGAKLDKVLRAAEKTIREQQAQHRIAPDGYGRQSPTSTALAILKQSMFQPALTILKHQREILASVFRARALLAERTADPETIKVVIGVEEVPTESMAEEPKL
jgi:hypothetical protein